jgi:hypothetical protein
MPGTPLLIAQERSRSVLQSLALREAAHALGHVGERALGFAHREQAELPETVARNVARKFGLPRPALSIETFAGRSTAPPPAALISSSFSSNGLSAASFFCHDAFSIQGWDAPAGALLRQRRRERIRVAN